MNVSEYAIRTDILIGLKNNYIDSEGRKDDIKRAAESCVPAMREKQESLIKDYLTAHAKDSAGYEFRCEKFGDFLAVFIKRTNPKYRWRELTDHIAAAVPLKGIAFRLINGHGVNLEGVNWPTASYESEPGALTKKYRVYIEPKYPYCPTSYTLFRVHAKAGTSNQCSSYSGGSDHIISVDNMAQPACDDRIVFGDDDMTIYAPFGRGREVYDAILAASRNEKP